MQPVPVQIRRPSHVRYAVLGLTVAAYMITYMDRQILAVARPVIRDELNISLVMMGWITFSFRIAYALFQIPGGWLGDRFGARRALALVVTWWSIFTGLTAMAWSAVSMLVIQVFFGVAGKPGLSPLPRDRCPAGCARPNAVSAQGITHAGSRLGAALDTAHRRVVIIAKSSAGAPRFWCSAFSGSRGPPFGSSTIEIRPRNISASIRTSAI